MRKLVLLSLCAVIAIALPAFADDKPAPTCEAKATPPGPVAIREECCWTYWGNYCSCAAYPNPDCTPVSWKCTPTLLKGPRISLEKLMSVDPEIKVAKRSVKK